MFVQLDGEDVRAGTLWPHTSRQGDSATFEYDRDYLAHPHAYDLDPALPRVGGRLHTPAGVAIFGAMGDCAPDGWGRTLILRSERESALREGRAPRQIREIDFLLGARDDQRQGALRFQLNGGPFLADGGRGVPPLVNLPRLLNAAMEFERDTANASDLRLLLRAGGSLGGARPKAHVVDKQGRVLIAKFPRVTQDKWDVTTWEAITLDLARLAGLDTPESKLRQVDGKPVLLIHRFDRDDADGRIGYVSGMTLLETTDGQTHDYFDLADVIARESPSAIADLHELWRRIAFGRLIHNTDDHLRNHGFLRKTDSGWSLSPVFDVNPNPEPGEFRTTLGGGDGEDPGVLLDATVAATFRLKQEQAKAVVREVADALASWREVADQHGAPRREVELMADAFESPAVAAIRDALK
ncbi:MAG: type II toxin-antitoxin system HipA family toxin [Solirubrobacteraceae bacterium]